MKRSLAFALLAVFAQAVVFAANAWPHPGWGIVMDRHGQVFFTDLKQIWRIDAQGQLTRYVAHKHTHQLFLDEHDNLWGEHITYDAARDRWWVSIWKAAPDGILTDFIPPSTAPPPGFSFIRDPSGNMYSWNGDNHERQQSQILRKTPEGNLTVLAGSTWGHADGKGSEAKLTSVGGMTWAPYGFLYVSDGPSVRRVAPNGTVTTLASGLVAHIPSFDPAGGGLFNRLMGLAADPQGNVYVANYGNRRVLKITPAGQVATLARTGWFWSPSGVTVAGHNVYVLEYTVLPIPGLDRARVRKISPDGHAITLATVGMENSVFFLGAVLVIFALLGVALVLLVRRIRAAISSGN